MATFAKFYEHIENLHNGVHDFSADTFKAMLTNDVPDVTTDTVKADLTDLSTGNGYTAGGVTLTSVTATQTSGVLVFSCADISWTASGGTIGPFRAIVIYNDTPTSPADPLIATLTFDTAVTIQSGDTFTRTINTTTGVYYGG